MASSGMLRRVALVETDVSEELSVTSQKTPFFIVTPVKTSNLTLSTLFIDLFIRCNSWNDS
jgi:hypothetical protein